MIKSLTDLCAVANLLVLSNQTGYDDLGPVSEDNIHIPRLRGRARVTITFERRGKQGANSISKTSSSSGSVSGSQRC